MSTESNRRWTKVDIRRVRAHELLEYWLRDRRDDRDHVLFVLARNPQARRLLAAVVAVATDPGHGDRYLPALREICELIYREKDRSAP
jgi:hypothetical protein